MLYFLMLEYHHPLVRLVCCRMQRSPHFADQIVISLSSGAILRNSSRKIVGHLNLCIAPIVDKLSHWTTQRFAQFIFRTHLSAMLIAPPQQPRCWWSSPLLFSQGTDLVSSSTPGPCVALHQRPPRIWILGKSAKGEDRPGRMAGRKCKFTHAWSRSNLQL